MTSTIIRDVHDVIADLDLGELLDMRDELPQTGVATVAVREQPDQPIILAPRVTLADESGEPLTAEEARELLTAEARELAMRSTDLDLTLLPRIDDSAAHDWWQSDAADRLVAEEAETAGLTPEQLDAALQRGLPDGTTTREVVRGAVERCTPIEAMDGAELRDFVFGFSPPDCCDDPDGFDDAQAVYERVERRAVEIIQGADSWTEVAAVGDALAHAAAKMSDASLENAR